MLTQKCPHGQNRKVEVIQARQAGSLPEKLRKEAERELLEARHDLFFNQMGKSSKKSRRV